MTNDPSFIYPFDPNTATPRQLLGIALLIGQSPRQLARHIGYEHVPPALEVLREVEAELQALRHGNLRVVE